MSHFKNILHNFGFHKMPKKDIDDELKKADPDFVKRTAVDFQTVKYVISYRFNKDGKTTEVDDCFNLFDKK